MHLVPIDFGLDLVHLIAHFIYPSLHNQIGLGGRVIHLVQFTKILANRRSLVIILRSDHIPALRLHTQFLDFLELLAESFVNQVI
jgi:hypothetical protein